MKLKIEKINVKMKNITTLQKYEKYQKHIKILKI